MFEEDVIRGNAAIFKCSTPTFVADFLAVDSWYQDDVPITKNDKYGILTTYKEHFGHGRSWITTSIYYEKEIYMAMFKCTRQFTLLMSHGYDF